MNIGITKTINNNMAKSQTNNIDTIERLMEDNYPDTTAELAHQAAILSLKPTTTSTLSLIRLIESLGDCA